MKALRIGLAALVAATIGCSSSGGRQAGSENGQVIRAENQQERIHVVGELGKRPEEARRATEEDAKAPPPAVDTNFQIVDPSKPQAPQSGRVGILSLITNELRHIHSSTFGGHEKIFRVQYDWNGYILTELRQALLTRTPYQPIYVSASINLRRAGATWHETWNGQQYAPDFQKEFDAIIKQNQLAMLIVVSYTDLDDGLLIGGKRVRGTGLYTRKTIGSAETAVFSTLQFFRIVGTPARLVEPVAPGSDRSIGALPGIELPGDLDDLPERYLAPIYKPASQIINNKIEGLIKLPRRLGN